MRPAVTLNQGWRFPAPEIHQLSNGVKVWAFNLPGQHVISAEMIMPVGVSAEPAHLEGVATLALRVCDEGTTAHPHGEISELLEAQGALVHGQQGHYAAHLRLEVPTTRIAKTWDLFAEILRSPAAAEADVEQHRDLLIAEYQQRLSVPRAITSLAFRACLYQDEDRRIRPESGTPGTISQITAPDVRSFHSRYWGPREAVIIIAGELPHDYLTRIEASYGDWAPQQIVPDTTPEIRPTPRMVCINKPDAVQADVTIGCYSIGRTDPRMPAAAVAGHVMAGAFNSRLNSELREKLGYTYGISGGFAPGRHGGIFSVSSSFRNDIAAKAIARSLEMMAMDAAITEAELDAAKNYALGVGPLANETASDITDQAARLVVGNVDVSYLHRHSQAIAELSTAEATRHYRELVQPEQLSLAVTGQAELLVDQLGALGYQIEVINLD